MGKRLLGVGISVALVALLAAMPASAASKAYLVHGTQAPGSDLEDLRQYLIARGAATYVHTVGYLGNGGTLDANNYGASTSDVVTHNTHCGAGGNTTNYQTDSLFVSCSIPGGKKVCKGHQSAAYCISDSGGSCAKGTGNMDNCDPNSDPAMVHTDDADLAHASYHVWWAIHDNGTINGYSTVMVGQSMGGGVLRYARQMNGKCDTNSANGTACDPDFNYGNTPISWGETALLSSAGSRGVDFAAWGGIWLGSMAKQLDDDNAFVQKLMTDNNNFYNWTAIGSKNDSTVPWTRAVDDLDGPKLNYQWRSVYAYRSSATASSRYPSACAYVSGDSVFYREYPCPDHTTMDNTGSKSKLTSTQSGGTFITCGASGGAYCDLSSSGNYVEGSSGVSYEPGEQVVQALRSAYW